jgi:hypothetical protein
MTKPELGGKKMKKFFFLNSHFEGKNNVLLLLLLLLSQCRFKVEDQSFLSGILWAHKKNESGTKRQAIIVERYGNNTGKNTRKRKIRTWIWWKLGKGMYNNETKGKTFYHQTKWFFFVLLPLKWEKFGILGADTFFGI